MTVAGVIVMMAGVAVLPEEVPVHWGAGWQPDRYGSPATYLLLPGILSFCNATMSFIVHFLDPDTWSKPSELREEDKPRWWQTSVSVVVGCEAVLGGWLLLDSLLTVAQLSDLVLPSIALLAAAMAAAIAFPLVGGVAIYGIEVDGQGVSCASKGAGSYFAAPFHARRRWRAALFRRVRTARFVSACWRLIGSGSGLIKRRAAPLAF